MSGGHFCDNSYPYFRVEQFAYELEEIVETNPYDFGEEVLSVFREAIPGLRMTAAVMRRIDYLCSGDLGEETFLERVHQAPDML